MNVTITPAAERFIRRMVRFGAADASAGFRLVVTAGGCSGLAGDFSIEAAPREGDAVLEHNGLRLFLPAESRLLLDGVTIDFADTPTSTGLTFVDPKAGACGCSSGKSGVATVAVTSIGRKQ